MALNQHLLLLALQGVEGRQDIVGITGTADRIHNGRLGHARIKQFGFLRVNRHAAGRKREHEPDDGNAPATMAAVTMMRKKPSIHSAIGPRRRRDGHVSEREEGLIKTHARSGNGIGH
jgi:hypothetical protein